MNATETKIREQLATRDLDYKTTAEIARAVGCSPATALRVLNRLLNEQFTDAEGVALCKLETDAGTGRGGVRTEKAPTKFVWCFQ